MIQEAIDDEAEEVRKTREETALRIELFRNLAVAFGLIAITAGFAGLAMLVRDIRRLIHRLLAGTRAFAAGEMDHRIAADGRSELDDVGRAFNGMADEIWARVSSGFGRVLGLPEARTAG